MTAPLDEILERARQLHLQGQLNEAEELCRGILRRRTACAGALHRLGLIAADRGFKDRALELLARAANAEPECAEFLRGFARVLAAYRMFGHAIVLFEQALHRDPSRADDYIQLASAYAEAGHSEKALEAARKAIALPLAGEGKARPEHAMSALATALLSQGRVAEAHDAWRDFLQDGRHAALHGAYVFTMHYDPKLSPSEIFAEHLRWAALYESPLAGSREPHGNTPYPGRRLRIGYVSPDFKKHPVSSFLKPLLRRHDASLFEIYCYANVPSPDSETSEYRKLAGDRWRDVAALDDEQLAQLIRADGIDILVDLAGHTGGNRLLAFAHKPAPVQVSWLGYADTTGLASMDYRITDVVADPPGETDHLHSERLWRLPSFLTWDLPADVPGIAPPPCLAKGYVTFGSFNNFLKLSEPAIDAWARILREVPGSRLMLKYREARDPRYCDRIRTKFVERGVDPGRIELVGTMPQYLLHLDSYREVDIALDPWPYNGTTTSCEALSMGVPMLALAGHAHIARVGASLLTQYGLADWIGETPDDYVRIAVERARDRQGLAALRPGMRDRLQAGLLGQPDRFARVMEEAFRSMWHGWVDSRVPWVAPERGFRELGWLV